MPTDIPGTTLVCVDCQYPGLALRALRLTLEQCRFRAVKFFTDATGIAAQLDPRIELVPIPRIASVEAYSRFMIKQLLPHVATDFVQVVQWDGYVINGPAWSSAFQEYDYIGARWWFREEGRDVGNGGFSLRSRRLLEALQDPDVVVEGPEDLLICDAYRDLLALRHGIRIAPASLARSYAFEGDRPNLQAFGFHRLFNFPLLYDEATLAGLLALIPTGGFRSAEALSTVRRLWDLGRTAEATRYATRFRSEAEGAGSLVGELRTEFEELAAALAADSADLR
jgi:hypothetical protein